MEPRQQAPQVSRLKVLAHVQLPMAPPCSDPAEVRKTIRRITDRSTAQQKCIEATILLEREEPAPHQRTDGDELNPVHEGTGRREGEERGNRGPGVLSSHLGSTLYRGRGSSLAPPPRRREGRRRLEWGHPQTLTDLGLGGGGGARGEGGRLPLLPNPSPWRLRPWCLPHGPSPLGFGPSRNIAFKK